MHWARAGHSPMVWQTVSLLGVQDPRSIPMEDAEFMANAWKFQVQPLKGGWR